MRCRLHRDERGFTLIEVLIVSALSLAILGLVGGLLISGLRTARFAEQETASLDDARIAQAQILKDLRSAVAADTSASISCSSNGAPVGYCLSLHYRSPSSGTQRQIRYRAVQTGGTSGPTTLYRDSGCDATFTCSTNRDLVTNLANRAIGTVMFSCDTTSSYPVITLALVVTPLSADKGSGTLTIATKARPRNIGGTSC